MNLEDIYFYSSYMMVKVYSYNSVDLLAHNVSLAWSVRGTLTEY